MKFKLDALHMTLLAALGLDLACAVKPIGSEADGETSGNTGDGDGDGDQPEPFACIDPQPILQPDSGLPSGFVTCEGGGFIHRTEKLEATDPQGPDSDECAMDEFSSCKTAADCVDDSYGRCLSDPQFGSCLCDYGCATDADCEPDQICAPAGVVGPRSECIPALCTIDADCGDGLCGVSEYEGCCGMSYMAVCADANEACHADSECPAMPCSADQPAGEAVDWQCSYQSDEGNVDTEWTCEPPGWCVCDCGRPFFVDGDARVASTLGRRDWCLEAAGGLVDVEPQMRARLAEHWTQIGRFEHASIASFARFGLQLMRLGAPPKLLRDTSRALADEIEHARLAFGLASAYAGAPVGPGGLDVGGAMEPTMDVLEIVDGLIAEACVGETLAAIEAHEAARWAEDPAVASVLERIAADEWRHAQLGWGALGWLVAQGGERLRSFVIARFEAVLRAVAGEGEASADLELRRHGVLDEALRAQVRREGIAKVIRPCVEALAFARVLSA